VTILVLQLDTRKETSSTSFHCCSLSQHSTPVQHRNPLFMAITTSQPSS